MNVAALTVLWSLTCTKSSPTEREKAAISSSEADAKASPLSRECTWKSPENHVSAPGTSRGAAGE